MRCACKAFRPHSQVVLWMWGSSRPPSTWLVSVRLAAFILTLKIENSNSWKLKSWIVESWKFNSRKVQKTKAENSNTWTLNSWSLKVESWNVFSTIKCMVFFERNTEFVTDRDSDKNSDLIFNIAGRQSDSRDTHIIRKDACAEQRVLKVYPQQPLCTSRDQGRNNWLCFCDLKWVYLIFMV
jgi:hypothetical protein